MFHVKHRAPGAAAILRMNVSRETSLLRGRKTRFCKTTPCIKKSSLSFTNMTCAGFGTSDTRQRPDSGGIEQREAGRVALPIRAPELSRRSPDPLSDDRLDRQGNKALVLPPSRDRGTA